jgi:hypothetical protein
MGWREFCARYRHLHKRMQAREAERRSREFFQRMAKKGG